MIRFYRLWNIDALYEKILVQSRNITAYHGKENKMFWNKKKKNESEEDLYDLADVNDEDDVTEDEESEGYGVAESESDEKDAYAEELEEGEEDGDFEEENDFEETEETLDGHSDSDGQEDTSGITVSARVSSLNSLAEFVSLRHGLNLQFMRKDSDEVFELRESHFRLARVWGSVSMYRQCSAEEYAKITLAMELLENPEGFYVLPALTDSDIKAAMMEFCEEKYGEKSKKYARNPKKFAKMVDDNGDNEEWKLFLKERLYKKTEDFCMENGITFSDEDGEESDE